MFVILIHATYGNDLWMVYVWILKIVIWLSVESTFKEFHCIENVSRLKFVQWSRYTRNIILKLSWTLRVNYFNFVMFYAVKLLTWDSIWYN